MKKRKRVLALIGIMALVIIGCGANETTEKNSETTSSAEEASIEATSEVAATEATTSVADSYTFDVADIAWSVGDGLIDGERIIEFKYTNNTPYPVVDVELTFKQKPDVTDEQLAVFNDVKTTYDWTDEELKDVYILGYNRKLSEPGETVGESPCVINGTYIPVENMEQYNIMEPSSMNVAYVKDGQICAVYYDYEIDQYSELSSSGKAAVEWSDGELAKLIPQPQSQVITNDLETEDSFWFTAYGFSKDDFQNYVTQCKEKGFSNIEYDEDDWFEASDNNGNMVNLNYNFVEESLSGRIEITAN